MKSPSSLHFRPSLNSAAPILSPALLIPLQARTFLKQSLNLGLMLLVIYATPAVRAQSCDNVPNGGGEGISADVTVNGIPMQQGMVIAPYSQVRIDSIASAFGSCTGMAWNCSNGCTCEPTGYVYPRNINHTNVWVDISTNTWLNGTYSVGTVWGQTSDLHLLDTRSSDSTGPNYLWVPYAGTYEIHVQGIINGTPCNLAPYQTEIVTITVQVGEGGPELGKSTCNSGVGRPINVSNGNMYIQQTDYRLPGRGEGLEITRTYNSLSQQTGVFGYGWSSILDESITAYGTKLLRLKLADGRAVYLARPNISTPYVASSPRDFHGQVVKNADNTYTLAFKEGRVHQFNASGKLVSMADRNGNTISLTLDGNGNPVTITDASGRTVTLSYDGYGVIGSMSDSLGTIATYSLSGVN